MTTYSLDESQGTLDASVKLIDNFFDEDPVINSNEFELMNSYFLSVCEDVSIARNFTSFMFKISANTGKPALELLEDIRGASKLEMNATIAYYLNLYKDKHLLYGISVIPQPVPTIQRNIIN
jgi:hypothetical protein